MPRTSSTSNDEHQRRRAQLEALRERLIGTDGRSRLINVNLSSDRGRFITLLGQDVDAIFEQMWGGTRGQGFTFRATEDARSPAARQLQTRLDQTSLDKRLSSIFRESRIATQEHGMDLLYLALGFLQWFESDAGNTMRTSPLILVPVTLERIELNRYRLVFREEELEQNVPLAKRLRDDFNVTLPVPNAEGDTPTTYFDRVREAIMDPETDTQASHKRRAKWNVVADKAQLGFFSFGKLRMYRDLDPEEGAWPERYLEEHTLAKQLLADGFGEPDPPVIDANERLDSQLDLSTACHVVDADNSQVRVLEEVRQARSLVIQGPPGTGKSQTITNIIASAVARGQTVLFVAEKMAALEVVSSKLKNIGLDAMCLELHSNRAIKSKVYQNLGATLNQARHHGSTDIDDSILPLEAARDQVNKIADVLHSPLSPGGYSARGIMDVIAHYDRVGLRPDFELPTTADITDARLDELRQLISEWHTGLAGLGDLNEHPLRAVRDHSLTPPYDITLGKPLENVLAAVREYQSACDEVERLLGKHLGKMRLRRGPGDLRELMQLLRIFRRTEIRRYVAALDLLAKDSPDFDVTRIRKELNRRFAPRRHNANQHLEQLVGDVVDEWGRDERRAVVRFLCHAKELLDTKELSRRSLGPLARALKLTDLEPSELAAASEVDWDTLRVWAAKVTGVELETVSGNNVLDSFRAVRTVKVEHPELSARLEEAHQNFVSAYKSATEKLKLCRHAIGDTENNTAATGEDSWLHHGQRPRVIKKLKIILGALDRYPDWADHLRRRKVLVDAQLEPLVTYCEAEHPGLQHTLEVFEYAVALARSERHIIDGTEANTLRYMDCDELVDRFRLADEASLLGARAAVRSSHRQAVPQGEGGSMARVRTEAGKQRQHPALRQFIRATKDVLPRIKPVFLMSPASVAQYLPMGDLQFDLVVFDEASQITPEDAMGSILRAKPDGQVIVVGDPKQLPPSRFFQRMTSDGTDAEEDPDEQPNPRLEENESILMMCQAQGLPTHMLTQHYRSKLPSLVEVSNQRFYDNRLALPPSPIAKTDEFGLRFIPVQGMYHPQRQW